VTTTATIVQDNVQADGSHKVRYSFTHVESGQTRLSGLYTLEAGTDIQAFGDALALQEDVKFKEREVEKAQAAYYAGENLTDLFAAGEFDILTEVEMQAVCVRDAANRMIRVPLTDVESLVACSVWTTALAPPVLRTALTNSAHTWAVGEANAFSSALDGLKVAADNIIAAGQGEQDVLDGIIP
jgi:hypothetical protein